MENAIPKTKEIEVIKGNVSKAVQAAEALEVKTAEDLPVATELLMKIKKVGKMITDQKETITKPMNEALRSARAFFSPMERQWETAEGLVKKKLLDYQIAQTKIADKKIVVIEKKVEAGKMSFEKAVDKIEAVAPQKTISTDTGSVQFRKVREVVIENEALIPREYLMLDMAKIKKVALAGVKIAGVTVVENQTVAGIRG